MKADPSKPPFAVGSRVRLKRPDNARHPKAGAAGRVISVRWKAPIEKWERGEPREIEPAVWIARVLFRKATWDDWRQRGVIDDAWDLFARELEACS